MGEELWLCICLCRVTNTYLRNISHYRADGKIISTNARPVGRRACNILSGGKPLYVTASAWGIHSKEGGKLRVCKSRSCSSRPNSTMCSYIHLPRGKVKIWWRAANPIHPLVGDKVRKPPRILFYVPICPLYTEAKISTHFTFNINIHVRVPFCILIPVCIAS